MSQVLGTFGLLDFTMLWPVFAWCRFETYKLFYFFHFQFFGGRGKQRITEAMDTKSADTGAQLYIDVDNGMEESMVGDLMVRHSALAEMGA
jgi:hypothetical protein